MSWKSEHICVFVHSFGMFSGISAVPRHIGDRQPLAVNSHCFCHLVTENRHSDAQCSGGHEQQRVANAVFFLGGSTEVLPVNLVEGG